MSVTRSFITFLELFMVPYFKFKILKYDKLQKNRKEM